MRTTTVRRRSARNLALSAAAALALVVVATGCASTVALESAPDANNPACAEVIVHLPTTIAASADGTDPGQDKRRTNAQSTAAWGDPTTTILSCGVPVPGPSTLRCISINDVDWLETPSDDLKYTYTSYGRDPAVQVYVDLNAVSGDSVLVDLSQAVQRIPATGGCTDPVQGEVTDDGELIPSTPLPTESAEPSQSAELGQSTDNGADSTTSNG